MRRSGMLNRPRYLTEYHMLRTECGATTPAAWLFDAEDPVAVTLAIGVAPKPVHWTMSRELLAAGMCRTRLRPAGDGDVQVHARLGVLDNDQPDLRGVRRPILVVDLMPPEGSVRLFLDGLIARIFLRRTYEFLPKRREDRVVARQIAAAEDRFRQVQS